MSEEETHVIMNMDKYAAYVRRRAALSFAEDYEENLDDFVTIEQVKHMISEHSAGKDEQDRYLLNESGYEGLLESLKVRLYNCGLSKLAAKNLLECAWDDEKSEMIFWTSDQPPEPS